MKLIAIGLVALSLNAVAGDKGNGGIGVVCRTNGKITDAKLLDLVEAEQRDEIEIVKSNVAYKDQLETAKKRIPFNLGQLKFDKALSEVKIKFLKNPLFGLPNPEDFSPRIIMKNCDYEVIGLYDDQRDSLEIDTEVFYALTETHKAAFIAHEIIYKAARMNGTKNSDTVRELVGRLFQKDESKSAIERLSVSPKALSVGGHCIFRDAVNVFLPVSNDGEVRYSHFPVDYPTIRIQISISKKSSTEISVFNRKTNDFIAGSVGTGKVTQLIRVEGYMSYITCHGYATSRADTWY